MTNNQSFVLYMYMLYLFACMCITYLVLGGGACLCEETRSSQRSEGNGEVAIMRGLRWRWVVPLMEEEVVTKLRLGVGRGRGG